MRSVERVCRILRRKFSNLGDVKPQIELKPLKDEEKFATIVEDRIRELAALDRYERRALSKRKSAIRAFDSACISRSNPKHKDVPLITDL